MGEASPDAVATIVRIVHSVIGTHLQHVASIEPEVVAAHGATEYVRRIQREPQRFVLDAASWDGWKEHDELQSTYIYLNDGLNVTWSGGGPYRTLLFKNNLIAYARRQEAWFMLHGGVSTGVKMRSTGP
jgi:hypothetical protein